jgi:hypothetical protein
LVLYDVSTLYFETDAADGFRAPGFSKERRVDSQITIGLLTEANQTAIQAAGLSFILGARIPYLRIRSANGVTSTRASKFLMGWC